MEYRRFENVIVARIDKGEEIIEKMKEICQKENVTLANVNALGAIGEFQVGLFNTKLYEHIHLSAGDVENKVYGGHLNKAIVSATCEMFIYVIPGNVERRFDEEIGLNLFKFE